MGNQIVIARLLLSVLCGVENKFNKSILLFNIG